MNYAAIKELLNNTQTKEKITYLFLFLFPIAGPVVRHWNSSFFNFTMLLSLFFLFSKAERKPMFITVKVEKVSFHKPSGKIGKYILETYQCTEFIKPRIFYDRTAYY